jgi:hypothetical protein
LEKENDEKILRKKMIGKPKRKFSRYAWRIGKKYFWRVLNKKFVRFHAGQRCATRKFFLNLTIFSSALQ